MRKEMGNRVLEAGPRGGKKNNDGVLFNDSGDKVFLLSEKVKW